MKTWLVTGASSGLGLSMTRKLVQRGERVVACVRRTETLEELAARAGERLRLVRFDVSDPASMRRELDSAFAAVGRIDVVVSNAGYGLFGAAEELSDAQIDQQLATNLRGSIDLVRAVLPYLRGQRGGRIVQVSSEGGQVAYPNFSVYHASKWGIEGFLEAVALEVAPFGIEIMIAEPGPTDTGFGGALVKAQPLPAYDVTPAGEVRRAIESGSFDIRGDAERTAEAILAAADSAHPPRRLALGSSAFENIERALTNRLTELRAQRDIAYAADRD